jgi:eukaryotic-like serine/threonine-protein kinase
MGEVYRARDTRLDRSVAIKILPDGLASDPGVRARFEREAKAISGLTHPNICALYDLGQQNGIDYLVMEYLEGETLASRIARGPLSTTQVMRYGAEIAQALHHAHRRGITHRDLKPGNVMLTAAGAKLLDFGLAKLAHAERVAPHDALTEAQRNPLTAEGTIVGTLPYMAPEQIEGRDLDARSDIFSLGVILYEMATGQRPFGGSSSAALAASILSSEPPQQPTISPQLDRVIRTALEKDPDQRWQTAHDLARQLRWIAEPSSGSQTIAGPAPKRGWPVLATAALIAIVAGVTVWLVARHFALSALPATRLAIALPAGHELFRSSETSPFAISPDGRKIALTAFRDGSRSLFVRSLDSVALHKLDGTDGAMSPFWSSDGAWIGYSTRAKLWKVRPAGGTPVAICDVPNGVAGSWQGDTILFAENPPGFGKPDVHRVSASGGAPIQVTKLNVGETEVRHSFPELLSDGKHFLYLASTNDSAERRLFLGSFDSQVRTRIATNVSAARLSGDRLLYVRDGKLLAQRFDVATGLKGDAETIAENVSFFFMTGRAEFDVSANGVLVYGTETSSDRLAVVDRKGIATSVLEDDASFYLLDVAPDGKKAAVTVRARATGLMDVWIYDLVRGVRDRLTADPGIESTPVWSPDGRTIVYNQASGDPPRLVKRAISAALASPVNAPGPFQVPGSFSPDGRNLYYTSLEGRSSTIIRLTLDGSNRSETTVDVGPSRAGDAQASPDGRWLAFVSDTSGRFEVYVQNLVSGERVRISKGGGRFPRWRQDSAELFYVTPDDAVTSVTSHNGTWDDAVIAELFRAQNSIEAFDPLPDGQGFLTVERTLSAGDALIHVAMGW